MRISKILGPQPSPLWVYPADELPIYREECELILTPEQQARLAEASRLRDLPYDGVGPPWFPPKDLNEFLRISSTLLREYTAQHILLMIQHLDGSLVLSEKNEREGGYVYIPRRIRPDVYRLLDYKRAVDLVPAEGLDLLLREGFASNARVGSSYRERCRNGGVKGGKARRELSEFNHAGVIRKAKLILMTNGLRRGLAGRIKESGCSDLSVRQINNILKSEM